VVSLKRVSNNNITSFDILAITKVINLASLWACEAEWNNRPVASLTLQLMLPFLAQV